MDRSRLALAGATLMIALAAPATPALAAPDQLTEIQVLDDGQPIPGGTGSSNDLELAADSVVSNDGRFLYVASVADNAVSVFSRDKSTGKVTAQIQTVAVPGSAMAIALSRAGDTAYVIDDDNDKLIAYPVLPDGTLGQSIDTEPIGLTFDTPGAITVSPDGDHVYAAAYFSGQIFVFDRNADGTLVPRQTLSVSQTNLGLDLIRQTAISPDGKFLYTSSEFGGSGVYSIDGTTGALTFVSFESAGDTVISVEISPDGRHLYLGTGTFGPSTVRAYTRDSGSGALAFIEAEPVAGGPYDIAIPPDGKALYAPAFFGATTSFTIDQPTGALTNIGFNAAVGGNAISISPDGRFAYLADYTGNSMRIYAREIPDTTAPDTTITKKPTKKKRRRSIVRFVSNEAGSNFRCSVDGADSFPCSSPQNFRNLDRGRHEFTVAATDPAGNTDTSPAAARFFLRRPR